LERARYEAERIERQYRAVEPENRLVARTLETAWEEALQAEAGVREEFDRWQRVAPQPWGAAERASVQALSVDIPALWRAATTSMAERKEIVRCLVDKVVVTVQPDSEDVPVAIHWQGGATTMHIIQRPVRRYQQLHEFSELRERIVQLRRQGHTAAEIAAQLNRDGLCTPKTRSDFTEENVRRFVCKQGLTQIARGSKACEGRVVARRAGAKTGHAESKAGGLDEARLVAWPTNTTGRCLDCLGRPRRSTATQTASALLAPRRPQPPQEPDHPKTAAQKLESRTPKKWTKRP